MCCYWKVINFSTGRVTLLLHTTSLSIVFLQQHNTGCFFHEYVFRDRMYFFKLLLLLLLCRIFGFVARKTSSGMDNVCHLFAEHDPEQPASAIVNFVSKVMIGSQKNAWFQLDVLPIPPPSPAPLMDLVSPNDDITLCVTWMQTLELSLKRKDSYQRATDRERMEVGTVLLISFKIKVYVMYHVYCICM